MKKTTHSENDFQTRAVLSQLRFWLFEYNVKVINSEILGSSREEANELKMHLGRFPFHSPESISKVITHNV